MTKRSSMTTVAILSAALVVLQILLTRVFSVVFLSHLGFAAISIGMLGLATAGVRVYVAKRQYDPANVATDVTRLCIYFALSLLVCTTLLTRLGANPLTFSWSLFGKLSLVYTVAAFPFYFGGLALTLMLTQNRAIFSTLYAADLAGAGIGGICAIGLLLGFNGPAAILFLAVAVSGLAFYTCPPSATRFRQAALGCAALSTALVALDATMDTFHVKHAKGREDAFEQPLFEKWNAFSRVAVYAVPQRPWSLGPNYRGEFPIVPLIDIDSSAATSIARADDKAGNNYIRYELTSAGYTAAHPGNALVIGAGGGRDVLTALTLGQKHVDAVEINPIIVNDIVRGDFSKVSGDLYDDPRVSVYVEDGRSFVRHATSKYDIIQLSLVDTWAATAAGALSLAENNLYTVEALLEYVDHLQDDGILTFTRWSGFEILRLLVELEVVCEQRGLGKLGRHVAIVETFGQHGSFVTSVIFRRSEIDQPVIDALNEQIKLAGFVWTYNPLDTTSQPSQLATVLRSDHVAQSAAQLANVEVRPSTDDWPFFFFKPRSLGELMSNPGDLFIKPAFLLVAIFLFSALASVLCVIVPLVLSRHVKAVAEYRRESLTIAPYFAALGLGFMFTEVCLTQRFVLYLGHPTYSLTVVLTSLLVGAGLGSLSASRMEGLFLTSPRRTGWLAVIAAVILVASSWLQPIVFHATQEQSFALRVFLSVLMVLPSALILGTLMPSAMACLTHSAPPLVPWAWGLNGFFSVLGSCGGALCAITWGFTRTAELGALCYAAAALSSFSGGLSLKRRA